MRTWDNYKEHAKSVDLEAKKDIEEAENLAEIVGAFCLIRYYHLMSDNSRGFTNLDKFSQ